MHSRALIPVVFLAGIALLFLGLLLILLGVRTSREAVHYEVRRVTGLGTEPPRASTGTIARGYIVEDGPPLHSGGG